MKVKPVYSSQVALKPHDFSSSSYFYFKSSLREAQRRKLYFCLALTSTLIVVAATAVSQTVLDFAPLIFLKAAESKAAAIDVTIEPLKASFSEDDGITKKMVYNRALLLNTTAIEEQVNPMYPNATTARYSITSNFKALRGATCRKNTSTPYMACPTYGSTFVLQNTLKEKELGIGTNIDWPTLPQGGIVITKKFAQLAQVSSGEKVIIRVDVTALLQDIAVSFNSKQKTTAKKISTSLFASSVAYIPFTVVLIVDDMNGKFPDGTADSVVAEYQHFFTTLAANMPTNSAKSHGNYVAFVEYLKREKPHNYANLINFNLQDRTNIYMNSNFDLIQDQVTNFASKISDALGVFPYRMTLPVYDELSDLKFGSLFLGITLNIIIVVLFLLSIILIYNILLVTVETKSFEFGVIRMIGLTKYGIAQLILAQALLFVLPGVILGLVLSVPLLMFVGNVLGDSLGVDIPIIPASMALFWSIFMGLAIPIISSYYPMKEALGKNLNLSLDLAHSKTSAVQVSIESEAKKFPWPQVTFGILTVLFGVAIYIILPLSLLSFNLTLLLGMFFAILLGLLVGLTLLSLNFQHFMERIVTEVFLFWTTTSFRSLVKKNLVAHKLRNRQAATMYSMALGFILFILVSLDQQLNSMSYADQADRGALIQLRTDIAMNTKLLEGVIGDSLSDVVESYSYISHDLGAYLKTTGKASDIEITHRGQLYSFTPKIRAVSPTIFKTTQNDFLVVNQADEDTGLDLGQQLYTSRGSQGIIIGETIREELGLSLDKHSSALIKINKKNSTQVEELRVLASLDSAPGFEFSKYPSSTSQDVLVSFPTYARLANVTMKDVPVNKLLIKVKDNSNANIEKVVFVMNQIKQSQYPTLKIWDFRDTQKSVEDNKSALSFIFKAVEILVMVLSMFSLVTSMSTNILEQTKEIAVLRAVGLTQLKVNLIYVCEAFVLIAASAVFGIIIGTAVAYILTVQSVLFTQLPITFSFPIVDVGIIFVTAIVSAFISSYFPAKRVTKLPISKIIRLGS